jgi:hypothetical protein
MTLRGTSRPACDVVRGVQPKGRSGAHGGAERIMQRCPNLGGELIAVFADTGGPVLHCGRNSRENIALAFAEADKVYMCSEEEGVDE